MSKTDKVIVAIVCATALFITSFVLQNDFAWDDVYIIAQYDRLGDASSLGTAFTDLFWENTAYRYEQMTNLYRPFTSFLLALTGMIFGTWALPYHAVSLAALFAAAFALYLLLVRIIHLENRRVAALACAALFVIHPLSAEVLCMTANAADHLALSFLLYCVVFIFDYIGDKTARKSRLLAASIFALLSIASKEFGIVCLIAPLIAFALKRGLEPTFSTKPLRSFLLWIAVALPILLYLAARIAVIHKVGFGNYFSNDSREWSLTIFVLGIGCAFLKSIAPVPSGASVFVTPFDVKALAAFAAYIAFVCVLIVANRRNKRSASIPLIGMLLGAIFLLPSLLIISNFEIGYRFPTRYFHLSLAGFLIAIAPLIASKWNAGLKIAVPAATILFALLSWMRIDEWRNDVTFCLSEAYYHPDSAVDLYNLSSVYFRARMFDKVEKTILEAEKTPDAKAPRMEAQILSMKAQIAIVRDGNLEKGTALLEEALTISPENLHYVYDLAETRARARRLDQAMIIMNTALNAPWFSAGQKADIRKHIAAIRQSHKNDIKP